MSNGKRKQLPNEDSSDEDDADMIDVEFEWFDPQEVDFHGLKVLLRQLFDVDNEIFDLSSLTNLILSQPLLGSTVKAQEDGLPTNETDPFAFLTVLNLHTHLSRPEIQTLVDYIASKSSKIPSLSTLPGLLGGGSSEAKVGLILSERFINMPAQVVPPMYKMLLEEMQWANEEGEPYTFSHYLMISKTYREVQSTIKEESETHRQKKSKIGKGSREDRDTFYFHAEDEVWQRFAAGYGNFEYTKQGVAGATDAKRAFQDAGIEPVGHMILIEADKFADAVDAVENFVQSAN